MTDEKNPFASETITPAYSAEWEAKRRVADAVRTLTEVLVTSSPVIDEMHRFAESLEQTATAFAATPCLRSVGLDSNRRARLLRPGKPRTEPAGGPE